MIETFTQQAYSKRAVKNPLSLFLSLALCALPNLCARADDGDKTVKPPYDPDVNSPTYDGSTFEAVPAQKPTTAQIQAAREAQQQQNSWLVRDYEEQLKKRAAADQSDLLDPYLRISSDQNLAKLAGLASPLSSNPTDITNLHAATDSPKDAPTLRLDPSSTPPSSPPKFTPLSGAVLKPLITPLTATDAAGLPNFYATLPAGTPPPLETTSLPPSGTDTSAALDMPGLTATQSRLTQGTSSYEITPGSLYTDPQNTHFSSSSEDELLPQLPSGDAASQLQHTVLVVTTGKSTPPPAPAKIVLPPDPELTPKPVAAPIIMGGRPQIQDPNDFIR
jgi:hypothetical protein